MVNQSLINSFTSLWPSNTWENHCIAQLKTLGFNWTSGLVNQHGQPMTVLNESTWGINMATCEAYCSNDKIPYPLWNFQSFSNCITNYFLPWIALTAQLPYETGDFGNNFMSFCMAVGSPALVSYSLTVTIMNRLWAKKAFDKLRKKASNGLVQQRYASLADRIATAQTLLQEGQQAPLRASQEAGWLSSLVVIPVNSDWWKRLASSLKNTRRGYTASLVAQMAVAVIAYAFTIVASFVGQFGDPTVALQIASGSLWLWQIPVIWGWIMVGTQYSSDTIEDALTESKAYKALPDTVFTTQSDPGEPQDQKGLVIGNGLSPLPHGSQSGRGTFEVAKEEHDKVPGWLGCAIEGDELRQGPIYNYARVLTWWQLATMLYEAFNTTVDAVEAGKLARRPADLADGEKTPVWPDDRTAAQNLHGDSANLADYCGLDLSKKVIAYPEWSNISREVRRRMVVGFAIAMMLQVGTTGASILIAYLTPTKGWGCRSGSYALYGILGIAVFSCLLSSMLASHGAMLLYQKKQMAGDRKNYQRMFTHNLLCGTAVILRRLGKTLAIVNAFWLITSSLLEFIGLFDNCWCLSDELGFGRSGWVVLFKNGPDFTVNARGAWGGGLVLTALVCFIAGAFFSIGSLTSYTDR